MRSIMTRGCHRVAGHRNVSRGVRQIRLGLVDPGDVGDLGCGGWPSEPVGFGGVDVVEDGLAVGSDGVVVAVVDAGGGVVADAGVPVVVVVVVEELVDEAAGVGEAGEAVRESWRVLQGFELGLAVGVVVGDVGSRVGAGDAEVGEELGNGS